MSLPRTFARRHHVDEGRYCLSSRNSPVLSRTNAFTVLPPLSPHIPPPPSTPKQYRCTTPAKKEKSSFVILTELAPSRTPSPPGGRVSPFRGRGFKPPTSSRHASPSPDPRGTPKSQRSRSKQARVVKGVVGKSAPSSPSKKSNIPKPILRRSSLSPNRAKELMNTADQNGNNLLKVNAGLAQRETINRRPPQSPRRVSMKLKDDIGSKVPKVPTSILKSPKKSAEKDGNNNKMVANKPDARKTVRNLNEMNRRNLDLRSGKENTSLLRKKSDNKDLNANVVKSPGKSVKSDARKQIVTQKPPLPVEVRPKPRPSPSPNPRKRSPLMPPKNTPSSNNKQPKKTNNNSNSRNSSPVKPIKPSAASSNKAQISSEKKTSDRGPNNSQNMSLNPKSMTNDSKNSQKYDDSKNSKISGVDINSVPSNVQNSPQSKGLNRSPKKESERKTNGAEPAKVEVVNEKKAAGEVKKTGSPSKPRPASAKSAKDSTAVAQQGVNGNSSVIVADTQPKVTSMVTDSSKPTVKRINQVQQQAQSGSSSESVRSSSSRDTIRAVARVKGTVLPARSKVGSVSGRVKGGPDLEVLSANSLIRQSDANHSGTRMAWHEPSPRDTRDLTNTTTTSAKPTGCLGNICKLLNCCKCCQSWQKGPKGPQAGGGGGGAAEKPSLLQRLNCFKRCPSLNISGKVRSVCGKLNCCRKLELRSCCEKVKCCKVPLSSCCRRASTSDDSSEVSEEARIRCAKMKSCWRMAFCLNRGCCQRLRQICKCNGLGCCMPGGCCGRISPEEEAIRKKRNARATFKKSRTSSVFSDIPKLDQTFVEYNSIMRAAIPVLPVPVAWMCLILNLFLPGVGTFWSGMMCLCVGKPRFSVNDTPLARIGSLCVNTMVALAQMFTVLFCLVGWGWAIWWGTIMLRLARKHRRIKLAEAGGTEHRPTPVVLNQNHADAERGQPSIRA